jgi:chaperonin GroEL
MPWLNSFQDEALDHLLKGAALLAEAVGSTMGPAGRNCVIDHTPYTPSCPLSTRDGITVCRSFYISDDPVADAGIRLMRAASEKTVEVAGDGTSATVVLAHGFFAAGLAELRGSHVSD